jgi:hypothetical protein
MANGLKRLVERHYDAVSKNPEIDLDKIRQVKYLHEFDRVIQVPSWGYPTEGAYYRDASSTDSLLACRIPIFAINAEDDPVNILLITLFKPSLTFIDCCQGGVAIFRSPADTIRGLVHNQPRRPSFVVRKFQRPEMACQTRNSIPTHFI